MPRQVLYPLGLEEFEPCCPEVWMAMLSSFIHDTLSPLRAVLVFTSLILAVSSTGYFTVSGIVLLEQHLKLSRPEATPQATARILIIVFMICSRLIPVGIDFMEVIEDL